MARSIEMERLGNGFVSTGVGTVNEAILNSFPSMTVALQRDSDGKLRMARNALAARQHIAADAIDTNVIRDVWSPSKAVLHFAGPLLVMKPPLNLVQLAFEPQWVLKALASLPQRAYSLAYAKIAKPQEMIMLLPESSAQN